MVKEMAGVCTKAVAKKGGKRAVAKNCIGKANTHMRIFLLISFHLKAMNKIVLSTKHSKRHLYH